MASTRIYGPTGAPGAPSIALNTVAGSKPVLPALLVGNVTTEQVLQNPALTSVALPVALFVAVPASSALEQQPFEFTSSGYCTVSAAMNVTLNLYSGSSTTVGNNTLLKSSGAMAIAAAGTNPFWVKGKFVYDSVSGLLTGTVQFLIGKVLVAEAVVTNNATGINDANNPVLTFCLSATFSVANAANLLNVRDLAVNF